MSDMNEIERRARDKSQKFFCPLNMTANWGNGFIAGWNAMRGFALENGYVPPEPPKCGARYVEARGHYYWCSLPKGHAEKEHRLIYLSGKNPLYCVWSDPEPETEAAT